MSISIHPLWIHLVKPRLLRELDGLGANVEVNEDGMVRATWAAGDEAIQSLAIVKLQVLPTAEYNAGWDGPGKLSVEGACFVLCRQLRRP